MGKELIQETYEGNLCYLLGQSPMSSGDAGKADKMTHWNQLVWWEIRSDVILRNGQDGFNNFFFFPTYTISSTYRPSFGF